MREFSVLFFVVFCFWLSPLWAHCVVVAVDDVQGSYREMMQQSVSRWRIICISLEDVARAWRCDFVWVQSQASSGFIPVYIRTSKVWELAFEIGRMPSAGEQKKQKHNAILQWCVYAPLVSSCDATQCEGDEDINDKSFYSHPTTLSPASKTSRMISLSSLTFFVFLFVSGRKVLFFATSFSEWFFHSVSTDPFYLPRQIS